MTNLNSKQGICFITAPDTSGADKVYNHVKDICDYGSVKFPIKQYTVTKANDISNVAVDLLDDYSKNQNRYLLQIDAHGYLRKKDKKFAIQIFGQDIEFKTLGDILAPLNIAYWHNLILLLNSCEGASSIMDEGRVFRNTEDPHVCRLLVAPKGLAKEHYLMHDYRKFYSKLLSSSNSLLIDCLDKDMVNRHELVVFDFADYSHYAAHEFLESADNPKSLNKILDEGYLKAGVQTRLKTHQRFKLSTRRELYSLIFKMFCNKNFILLINSENYKSQIGYYEFIDTLKSDEIKYRKNYTRRATMKVDVDAIEQAYFKRSSIAPDILCKKRS